MVLAVVVLGCVGVCRIAGCSCYLAGGSESFKFSAYCPFLFLWLLVVVIVIVGVVVAVFVSL